MTSVKLALTSKGKFIEIGDIASELLENTIVIEIHKSKDCANIYIYGTEELTVYDVEEFLALDEVPCEVKDAVRKFLRCGKGRW